MTITTKQQWTKTNFIIIVFMKNLLLVPFLSRRRNYDTCIISIIILYNYYKTGRWYNNNIRGVSSITLLNDCEVNEVVAEEQW